MILLYQIVRGRL